MFAIAYIPGKIAAIPIQFATWQAAESYLAAISPAFAMALHIVNVEARVGVEVEVEVEAEVEKNINII